MHHTHEGVCLVTSFNTYICAFRVRTEEPTENIWGFQPRLKRSILAEDFASGSHLHIIYTT